MAFTSQTLDQKARTERHNGKSPTGSARRFWTIAGYHDSLADRAQAPINPIGLNLAATGTDSRADGISGRELTHGPVPEAGFRFPVILEASITTSLIDPKVQVSELRMVPIDLQKLAATAGYRVAFDPSIKVDAVRAERPWQVKNPGEVRFYQSAQRDRACRVLFVARLFTSLMAIPSRRVLQRGDPNCALHSPPGNLELVATLLRARRHIVLPEAERVCRAELVKGAEEIAT